MEKPDDLSVTRNNLTMRRISDFLKAFDDDPSNDRIRLALLESAQILFNTDAGLADVGVSVVYNRIKNAVLGIGAAGHDIEQAIHDLREKLGLQSAEESA